MRSVDWRPWLALGAAVVLGLFRLDVQPMWLDERITVAIASGADEEFWRRALTDQSYTGLFYLLMRGWLTLGQDPFVARLPSLAFAALTAPAVYVLAVRLFDRRAVALVAALLLASNGMVVRYGQEARAYSLAMLLATLAALALVHALDHPSARRWTAYALLAAAAVYGHLFTLLVVPLHLAVTAAVGRLRQPALNGFVLLAVLLAPLGLSTLLFRHGFSWIDMPGPGTLPRVLNMLVGGPADADRLPIHLAVFGAAALIGAALMLREDRRWRLLLLAGWAVLPLAAALVGSYVAQPMIVARYFLFSTPPLMILAGYGVMSLPQRWQRAAGLGGLLAVAGYGLWWLYFVFEKRP